MGVSVTKQLNDGRAAAYVQLRWGIAAYFVIMVAVALIVFRLTATPASRLFNYLIERASEHFPDLDFTTRLFVTDHLQAISGFSALVGMLTYVGAVSALTLMAMNFVSAFATFLHVDREAVFPVIPAVDVERDLDRIFNNAFFGLKLIRGNVVAFVAADKLAFWITFAAGLLYLFSPF